MRDVRLAALLCKVAHCNHAHRSRLARVFEIVTPWTVVWCCVCGRIALRRSKTKIVKP